MRIAVLSGMTPTGTSPLWRVPYGHAESTEPAARGGRPDLEIARRTGIVNRGGGGDPALRREKGGVWCSMS